ncbi:hypothetical protein AGMMS50284_6370 [Clostridia bacterium]|nr:hypothetical protein AGMMS50284_6370 [Clostridia bacterium]
MNDVYKICPSYNKRLISLHQTIKNDAADLLKCYSDKKSVLLFNSDNCHGDDFYYATPERMEQAIDFWNFSYKEKYFVRWSIVVNETDEVVGTVEMFHRTADDEFNHTGILRIDLRSDFEKEEIINEILEIANENFYELFDVEVIFSKAISVAEEKIKAFHTNDYLIFEKPFIGYLDYYYRKN